jgi:hypothetical protein
MVLYTLELGRAAGDGEDLGPWRLQARLSPHDKLGSWGRRRFSLAEKKMGQAEEGSGPVWGNRPIDTFLLLFIFRIANPNSQ